MSRRVQFLIVLAIASGTACDGCDTTPLNAVATTALTIDSPAANANYGSSQSFDYHATAKNRIGVRSLALEAGGKNGVAIKTLNTCDAPGAGTDGGIASESGSSGETTLTCDFNFSVVANADLIAGGTITLTAVAVDTRGATTSKTIIVTITPPACHITAPPVTSGTTPPTADVSGTSALTVTVAANTEFKTVEVTSDMTTTLANWSAAPYSEQQHWATTPGLGKHTLVATCTDSQGNVSSDSLDIFVKCGGDSDCKSGDRCCSNDGTCNPSVAEGADCDCDHPCPSSQGCFPGICGATPAKCYPGCFPGSDTGNGQVPQTCPDQGNQKAFCNALPADQVTTQNMGGACVVGDGCDVVSQNCPNLPLDRSQPVSATNPLVPYNCLPVAPNLTGCYPAGTVTQGQANCNQVCGSVSAGTSAVTDNCAKGYECVQEVDQDGDPLGPASCEKQCNNPSMNENVSNECPGGDGTCVEVYQPYGQQMVYFTTGSCCVLPEGSCTTNTECCDGTCEGGTCD